MRKGATTSAGFTLLEVVFALTLLVIVGAKAVFALREMGAASETEMTDVVLESKARTVLTRIGRTVMEAYEETLAPTFAPPFDSTEITYRVNLGVEDGEVVLGEPERIGVDLETGKLSWVVMPGEPDERSIAWSNLVAPFLEGEIPNGMDDNGNGVIDEKGLSFVIDRRAVTIRLTLERRGDGDEVSTKTVETTVTCRNPTRVTE
ncbi:MAG: hypothetical protein GY711_31100 [bacterium]|nr:hypothetical protein [bacterium]